MFRQFMKTLLYHTQSLRYLFKYVEGGYCARMQPISLISSCLHPCASLH